MEIGGAMLSSLSLTGSDGIVRTSGNQTIRGVKTFSVNPLSATVPVTDSELVNKLYVDSTISAGGFVTLAGVPQTITSAKTFQNDIFLVESAAGNDKIFVNGATTTITNTNNIITSTTENLFSSLSHRFTNATNTFDRLTLGASGHILNALNTIDLNINSVPKITITSALNTLSNTNNTISTTATTGVNTLSATGTSGVNTLFTNGASGSNLLESTGLNGYNTLEASGTNGSNTLLASGVNGYNELSASGALGNSLYAYTGNNTITSTIGSNTITANGGTAKFNRLDARGTSGYNYLSAGRNFIDAATINYMRIGAVGSEVDKLVITSSKTTITNSRVDVDSILTANNYQVGLLTTSYISGCIIANQSTTSLSGGGSVPMSIGGFARTVYSIQQGIIPFNVVFYACVFMSDGSNQTTARTITLEMTGTNRFSVSCPTGTAYQSIVGTSIGGQWALPANNGYYLQLKTSGTSATAKDWNIILYYYQY